MFSKNTVFQRLNLSPSSGGKVELTLLRSLKDMACTTFPAS